MITTSSDFYEVLQCERDASQSEVKAAFYRLLPSCPPEQNPKEYQLLREAYDVLSNPVSRVEYDSMSEFGDEIDRLRNEAEEFIKQDEPDYDRAEALLKRAIVLGPKVGMLRALLGQLYLQTEDYDGALRQYQKAKQIDGTNGAYLIGVGRSYEGLEEYAPAEAHFRKAWKLDPEDYEAPRALAGVLHARGQTQEGLDVLTRAIEADGKVDFQDFFCYYDRLMLLLFSSRHDEMEAELATIIEIAKLPAEKEFGAFMLARTGAQLYDLGAHILAQEFTDSAHLLDPDNEFIAELASETRRFAAVDRELAAFGEDSKIHDVVKQLVGIHGVMYVGGATEEEYEASFQEVLDVLPGLMETDPHASKIKTSLRRVRREYKTLFEINPEFFGNILALPEAPNTSSKCPSCRGMVIIAKSEKWGVFGCPHCETAIEFSGNGFKRYEQPSRSDRYYTPSSGGSQASSSEDCFVATAVYGDPKHRDVVDLRHFRDAVLRESDLGRKFIAWYYRHGPSMARWISPHVLARSTVRWVLGRFVSLRRLREGKR